PLMQQGVAIGLSCFVKLAGFFQLTALLPQRINVGDFSFGLDGRRLVSAEIEVELSGGIDELSLIEADEKMTVAFQHTELIERIAESGQPFCKLLQAAPHLVRRDARLGQAPQGSHTRDLVEIEIANLADGIDRLDKPGLDPGAEAFARDFEQSAELSDGELSVDAPRSAFEAEALEQLFFGHDLDGAAGRL